MEEFKHLYEVVVGAVVSIVSFVTWRYKKDITKIDKIDERQDFLDSQFSEIRAAETITKAELIMLKQQFNESRKELREDFKEIKDSISRLHDRLDKYK